MDENLPPAPLLKFNTPPRKWTLSRHLRQASLNRSLFSETDMLQLKLVLLTS